MKWVENCNPVITQIYRNVYSKNFNLRDNDFLQKSISKRAIISSLFSLITTLPHHYFDNRNWKKNCEDHLTTSDANFTLLVHQSLSHPLMIPMFCLTLKVKYHTCTWCGIIEKLIFFDQSLSFECMYSYRLRKWIPFSISKTKLN